MNERVILWWMLFIGIICHMFQMTNINVAIISMVRKPNLKTNSVGGTGLCSAARANSTNIAAINETNDAMHNDDDKFDWNEQEQNLILSAFYWLSWASELCGGMLSHKYGTKITFGFTTFIACILSSAVPTLAHVSTKMVIAIRLLQGTIGSVGLPAGIMTIIGHWAPPHERGKLASATLGIPLGISIGYPFFGLIQTYLSWEYVFHATTALGAIWYLFWYVLIYDTPDQHPRISEKERNYIKKSLANTATTEKLPIPWKNIFTSVPIFVNILTTFGQTCMLLSFGMFIPMYLKNVYDMNSKMIGTITGISFLIRSLLQIPGAVITDSMIRRGMSKTRVRNMVVFISSVIPGLMLLPMPYTRCDVTWSLILLISSIIMGAFVGLGAPVALIDMSPNFCGIIQGIICAIATSAGFLSPLVFNYLSLNYDPLDAWGYLFFTMGVISAIPGLAFIAFSDSELQSWNDPIRYTRQNTLEKLNPRS